MTRARVGLATSEDHPDLTPEDREVVEALAHRGIDAVPVVWSATPPEHVAQDLVVIRSCWDYHHRPEEFLAWADAVSARGVRVLNAPATLRRNAHKQYLLDLEAAGAAIVPTHLARRGDRTPLATIARAFGADSVVIKPAVSASSFHTARLDAREAGSEHTFRAAVEARDTLVQPFLETITRGELSLIFLGGRFSHAVIKRAKAGDFRVQEEYGGHTEPIAPSAALIEQAERVLNLFDAGTLYARMDGIEQDGRFILAEAELIEPYLFLGSSPGGIEGFAAALDEARRA